MKILRRGLGTRLAAGLAGALAGLACWAALGAGTQPLRTGNLLLLPVSHAAHGAVTRLLTSRRVVALSIDDGPDGQFTPALLSLLQRAHAHATFFIVGESALARRDLIRRELRGGDELANHTYSHPYLPFLSPAATRREVLGGRSALIRAGAPSPSLFRAPYGKFTAAAAHVAAREGELMVAWSLTVERALDGRSVPHAVAWMMRRMQPGMIILAHDGRLDRTRTLRALPLLLAALARRHYSVVTVSELLRQGGDLSPLRLARLGVPRHVRAHA